ncbi:MAG TPA: VWA domain-containing protein [Candidatus Paceibacterota bacterium]
MNQENKTIIDKKGYLTPLVGLILFLSLVGGAEASHTYKPSAVPPWKDLGSVELNNDLSGKWAPAGEESFTLAEPVTSVAVYGGSDDGGYCLAYWPGAATPGWVAAYRHKGDTGIYNDNTVPSGSCADPKFDSDGNVKICQKTYNHGNYVYFQNSLTGKSSAGEMSVDLPAGTEIKLKAQNNDSADKGYSRCFLKVMPSSLWDTCPGNDNTADFYCPADWNYNNYTECLDVKGPTYRKIEHNDCKATCSTVTSNTPYYSTTTSPDCTGMLGDWKDGSYGNDTNNRYQYCQNPYNPVPSVEQWTGQRTDIDIVDNSPPTCSWNLYGNEMDPDVYNGWTNLGCSISEPCPGNYICMNIGCDYAPVRGSPSSCPLNSDSPIWTQTYQPRNGGMAYGYDTAIDSVGNIYVVGEQLDAANPLAGMDMFLAKYQSNGMMDISFGNGAGVVVFDAGGNESGYGVAVNSTTGDIYVAGRRDINGGDMFLIRYNSSGVKQWDVSYDNSGGSDVGRDTAVAGGNIYVTGHVQNPAGDTDLAIWRYDSGGTFQNIAKYDAGAGQNESGFSVVVNSSDVFAAGYRSTNMGDAILVKYDGALSSLLWASSYASSLPISGDIMIVLDRSNSIDDNTEWPQAQDFAKQLISFLGMDTGNKFGVVMFSDNASLVSPLSDDIIAIYTDIDAVTDTDGWTYTNKGIVMAQSEIDTNGRADFPHYMIVVTDGQSNIPAATAAAATAAKGKDTIIFAIGVGNNIDDEELNAIASDPDSQFKFLVSNFKALLNTITLLMTTDCCSSDGGYGLALNGSLNEVYMTGYQAAAGGDMFLTAYDTGSGANKWAEVYDSEDSGNDVGRGVVASGKSDRRVYVAGERGGENGADVFLHEYIAAEQQAHLRNEVVVTSSGSDNAGSMAINPDQEIFVSGYRDLNGGEAFLSKYGCGLPMDLGGMISNGYFTLTPASAYANAAIYVDATQSGSGISKYEWDWDYGGTPPSFTSADEGVTSSHKYASQGSYTIALRITYVDTKLQPTIVTQFIPVYENHSPTASFVVATTTPPVFVNGPVSGAAPLVVTVNGSGSDPDGLDNDPGDYIKNFVWNWGDGTPNGQGQQTTHLYSRPLICSESGTCPFSGAACTPDAACPYVVSLTVEDSVGAPNSFSSPVDQDVTVTEQYFCSAGCGANKPVCWLTPEGATDCFQCVPGEEYQCGFGYECAGSRCRSGELCPDGVTKCPADGICSETIACDAGSGELCPDSSVCPDSGLCPPAKNFCKLTSDTQKARCYTEAVFPLTESGVCASDLDCTASLQGGVCETDSNSPYYQQCKYAHCLNETSFPCDEDKDCNNADGVCYKGTGPGQCIYIHDCAYGPEMGGKTGDYSASAAKPIPAMPLGIQPNGEACTKPTPDAPNNCEGINGCLYYNYNSDGTPVAGDAQNPIGSSVANCLNKFESGTGCVYYGDQADAANSRVNCLPSADFSKLKSKTAPDGIPAGCVVMDKGDGKKEYNCTSVNGCYYYLNGVTDCDYALFDSDGNDISIGCIYEPNPAGAIFCPRAFKTPTGGSDYIQCLLNPDAVLPSFLLGDAQSGLGPCRTSADCPADAPVCLDGTCYPACQGDVDCVTGGQCLLTCEPFTPCQAECTLGTTCSNGALCQPDPNSSTGGSCPAICNNAGLCLNVEPQPDSFSCVNTTVNSNLPYGTPSADISVRSSVAAACRWSLFDVSFASMTGPFNTGDSINHTATAVGFPPVGNSVIYSACQNGTGAVYSCNVPLKLGDTCQTDADCYGDLVCINGWCVAPVCDNAQPQGSQPYSALADGVTIGMTTSADANCVYSDSYSETNACVNPIPDSCVPPANSFTTTGGQTHSSYLPGSSLVIGNNTQYAKCQEIAAPQSLSATCQIPFSVLTCDPHAVINECSNGWDCVEIGTGPGICVPPACSSAQPPPGAKLPYTATSTDIGLTTTTLATCAYSNDPNADYFSMTPFSNTGETIHSTSIDVERNTSYYRYVICDETATDNFTKVCTIHFSVGDLLPICDGAYPSGQQDVDADVPIGLKTNQETVCKFSDTYDDLVSPQERYDAMPNTFKNINGLTHGTDGNFQDTVTVVQGDNTKYVSCRVVAAPNKIDECRIPFSGRLGPCTLQQWGTDDCPLGESCNPKTGDCVNPCDLTDPPSYCFPHPKPCDINPSLCNPGPSYCSLHPDDLQCSGSCNTLGYEFHGTAIKPSGNCSLLAIILALLSWLAWFVALLAVLSGLRAAYLYITSAGDEKKLRLAYSYLIYTTIGVGVAILSFSAVAITRAILNI